MEEDKKKIQKDLFLKYLKLIEDIKLYKKNERIKKQAMYFFKGIDGAKNLRVQIQKEKNFEKILELVKEF